MRIKDTTREAVRNHVAGLSDAEISTLHLALEQGTFPSEAHCYIDSARRFGWLVGEVPDCAVLQALRRRVPAEIKERAASAADDWRTLDRLRELLDGKVAS